MSWSTPDPRPADPVLGDPASVSALAAVLQRTAGELTEAVARATDDASHSRRHAARLRVLRSRATEVTSSMERTGHRLAEHSADLADALGLAGRIVDRAESLGLAVDGPDFVRARGVHGLADAATEETTTHALLRLQHVLDTVLLDLETHRGALRADLAAERARRASR